MIKKRFVVTAECVQRVRHLELKSQDIGMNKLFVKTHKKRDIRCCCPAHTPYYNIISHTHTSQTIINN